ncbi:hypothetical protein FTX61_11890 [Nitriliruptoraceae bacterium ZYF776]|nr:hypothetical protein [Profundirhabdus halotolerans]
MGGSPSVVPRASVVPLPDPFAWLRAARRQPEFTIEPHPDDLPKTGLFAEPIRVTNLKALDPEVLDDGRHRASFLVEVRDADDRRCTDIAVEVRIGGPERTRTVQGTTDLMGRIRFRMAGPAGTYTLHLTDVGAHGLAWDADAGPRDAEVTAG